MSAEQHKFSSPPEGAHPQEWVYDKDKHLDVYSLFVKFWDNIQSLGIQDATRRRRRLLEANFRSYTQENNAISAIYPVAIEVNKENLHRIRFRHTYHYDFEIGQAEELARIPKGKIKTRFKREQDTYRKVWNTAIEQLVPFIGRPKEEFAQILHQQGFHKEIAKRQIYDLQKKETGIADHAVLFDAVSGVAALFVQLQKETEIEVYTSPQWYGFISPQTPVHQEDKTSIGRLARVFYVPLIDKIFIADEGLYSGFHEEINELLKLDNERRPVPSSEEELLAFIALLSQEKYARMAPHAIFQEIVDQIGYFTPAPIGEGVRVKESRDFTRQIEYIENVLDFEYERCIQNPELLQTLAERFNYANKTVMHALLRANDTTLDVPALTKLYKNVFGLDLNAYNPNGVERLMNIQTVNVYGDFINRAQSLGDCALGSLHVGGLDSLVNSASNLGNVKIAFGSDFDLGNASYERLLEGIQHRRRHDFANADEARAFAEIYGINPDWIGTVINHYPNGKHCDECKQSMHWVGECGGHTMCLQCNAEYNLTHGLVDALSSTDGDTNRSANGSDNPSFRTIGPGDWISAATTGDWEQFQLAA